MTVAHDLHSINKYLRRGLCAAVCALGLSLFAAQAAFAIYIPAASPATQQVIRHTSGAVQAFTDLGKGNRVAASYSGAVLHDPTRRLQDEWSVTLQRKDGSYFGAGQGAGAAFSFNAARWGGKTAFLNSEDAVSGILFGVAENGDYAAFGLDAGRHGRLAVASASSKPLQFPSRTGGQAAMRGAALSYTVQPAGSWKLSLSGAHLKENNPAPAGSGYLHLRQTSMLSFGIGASADLGAGYSLGLDTMTAAGSAGFSLVLNKADVTGRADDLGVSVKRPPRIFVGNRTSFGRETDGRETDFGLNYRRALPGGTTAGFSLSYRHDADHVAGSRDAASMFRFSAAF